MGAPASTLHVGDCVERLKKISAGSIDLVFADPPFNIGYDYDVYDDRQSRDDYLNWSRAWMSGVFAALKPTGTFWLAIGDEYAAHLRVVAEDKIGFKCRSWVIWYYTFGVNCVRGFSRSHTHLFHFVKDPDNFTFNAENPTVRVPSARQLVYADGRANQRGRLPDNTWITRPQDAPPFAFAPSHDTWYFARVAGTFKEREGFHGCQMPEQLLGRIIRVSSSPGELVLDPFSGSGTTLAVAKKLGRQWLGIELSRDYVKRIKQRLKGISTGDPLTGPADPRRSAPTTSRGKRKVRLRNGKPLLQADEDTRKAIIAAYSSTCRGYSADYMLCDPDMNGAFIGACKKESLPGDAFIWNRLLLRVRKSGDLPRSRKSSRRFTFEMMDCYSYASEIAMQLMSLDYGLKLDDLLCMPTAAAEFDHIAERFAPGYSSFEYRWAALAIRKRATKSRKLAQTQFLKWLRRKLPRATPLSHCVTDRYEQSGVYVLNDDEQPLYVGETLNLRSRVEDVLSVESWAKLGASSLKFVPHEDQNIHGLQSILIHRVNPFLNSHLLRPRIEAGV
ncbi:MAG: site-specific DNA-methyltransferase [Planctomycetes bacterium]|nr:site-specific DNA-methyltransferase [Planctomycetota bacterium]